MAHATDSLVNRLLDRLYPVEGQTSGQSPLPITVSGQSALLQTTEQSLQFRSIIEITGLLKAETLTAKIAGVALEFFAIISLVEIVRFSRHLYHSVKEQLLGEELCVFAQHQKAYAIRDTYTQQRVRYILIPYLRQLKAEMEQAEKAQAYLEYALARVLCRLPEEDRAPVESFVKTALLEYTAAHVDSFFVALGAPAIASFQLPPSPPSSPIGEGEQYSDPALAAEYVRDATTLPIPPPPPLPMGTAAMSAGATPRPSALGSSNSARVRLLQDIANGQQRGRLTPPKQRQLPKQVLPRGNPNDQMNPDDLMAALQRKIRAIRRGVNGRNDTPGADATNSPEDSDASEDEGSGWNS